MSDIKEKYQFVTQSDQKWTAIAIEEGNYKEQIMGKLLSAIKKIQKALYLLGLNMIY